MVGYCSLNDEFEDSSKLKTKTLLNLILKILSIICLISLTVFSILATIFIIKLINNLNPLIFQIENNMKNITLNINDIRNKIDRFS